MRPIITNQHLNNLISVLLVALFSKQWQSEHQNGWPMGRTNQFLEDFDALTGASGAGEPGRLQAIEVLQKTLNQIQATDSELRSCGFADLAWLSGLSQAEPELLDQLLATFWVWLHPMDEEMTPQEALSAMPEEEQRDISVIYRRMQDGFVPGAVKRGRQWLIPKSSLVALGWLAPDVLERRLGTEETIRKKPNKKPSGRPPGRRNKK